MAAVFADAQYAFDADVCALVRRILVRAVSGHYERSARRAGVVNPRAGAVAFVQRCDSGLRITSLSHGLVALRPLTHKGLGQ